MAMTKNIPRYVVTTNKNSKHLNGTQKVFSDKNEADKYAAQLVKNGIDKKDIGFFLIKSKEPV